LTICGTPADDHVRSVWSWTSSLL